MSDRLNNAFKHMRKASAAVLAAALVFTLTACGAPSDISGEPLPDDPVTADEPVKPDDTADEKKDPENKENTDPSAEAPSDNTKTEENEDPSGKGETPEPADKTEGENDDETERVPGTAVASSFACGEYDISTVCDGNGNVISCFPAGSYSAGAGSFSGEKVHDGAPSKGDDHSILGIPEVKDTRVTDDGNIFVLVNKVHAVEKGYTPANLVTIKNKYGTYTDMQMQAEAYDAYKKMYSDACDLGFDLKLCSTVRSWDTQKTLFNNSLKNRGRETTNLRSAYPGRSEHHTGLAIDVTSASMGWGLTQDFADYADGQWINEHCQEYGFIVRYPKGKSEITGYAYEPWHLRYVGIPAATYIMGNGITLEEFLGEA